MAQTYSLVKNEFYHKLESGTFRSPRPHPFPFYRWDIIDVYHKLIYKSIFFTHTIKQVNHP